MHHTEGHSCVKGRFAWGYATHKERVMTPLIRENIDDPWKVAGWDEAIQYAADRFKAIQKEHGRKSIGGITSSRCTNEEVYIVQKLIRARLISFDHHMSKPTTTCPSNPAPTFH